MERGNVKVQSIFHRRNNITCSTNCTYRTVATLYTLETGFVSDIWTDVIYVKWFYFEGKWSELKWVTVKLLRVKVPCTLGWPYTEGAWLYCDCLIWEYLVLCLFQLVLWCVGVLVTCVLVFTVFCIVCTVFFVLFLLCIFILTYFVSTSVRNTATEWQPIAVSTSNNNNNYRKLPYWTLHTYFGNH